MAGSVICSENRIVKTAEAGTVTQVGGFLPLWNWDFPAAIYNGRAFFKAGCSRTSLAVAPSYCSLHLPAVLAIDPGLPELEMPFLHYGMSPEEEIIIAQSALKGCTHGKRVSGWCLASFRLSVVLQILIL